MPRLGRASFVLASILAAGAAFDGAAFAEQTDDSRWCAPELATIGDTVCFVPHADGQAAGAPAPRRTLVIFLHSLVGATGTFRWDQQRLITRIAQTHGLAALMPKGRPALGPGRDPNVIAWPTSSALRERFEDELIAEWMTAKEEAEKRAGKFDEVFVFGFSNGAYYATSLALRGRLEVDGYAVFAGGSGGKYSRLQARSTARRVPIFVAYGTKDPDHRRQEELVAMLSDLGWKHRGHGDRIGHTVSNAQVRGALSFLRGEEAANSTSASAARQKFRQ